MEELKRIFDACREYRGHTIMDAASKMNGSDGYSKTTIDRFFKNDLKYMDNVDAEVRKYIYETGIVKSIHDLGLDPNVTKGEMQSSNSSVSL